MHTMSTWFGIKTGYDNGAHGLPCARGPHVPHARGMVRGDLHGILGAGIWYAIALVPPLVAMSIRLGAT
jgi:hypothetical protein